MVSISESAAADWDASQSDDHWHEAVTGLDHSDASKLHKGQSYNNPFKSGDLVAYYPLSDDDLTNLREAPSTTNGDGAYDVGGVAQQQNLLGVGQTGFDGDDDFADYETPIPSGYSGGLTVSLWVYVDSFDSGADNTIMSGSSTDTSPLWIEQDSSGDWNAAIDDNSTVLSTATKTVTGEWIHFVLAGDTSDGSHELYINATLEDSSSDLPSSISTSGFMHIAANSTPTEFTDCKIADIQWWTTKFTSTEVQNLNDLYAGSSSHWTDKKSSTGDSSSVDLTTTTSLPAGTSVTVTLFQDDDADGAGANTDALGNSYDNSASVTLSGGTETNTLTGFDADGSTDNWWLEIQADPDSTDLSAGLITLDSWDVQNAVSAGSVRSTTAAGVIQTTSAAVIKTVA